MTKIKFNNLLQKVLIVFLIIQPIFDLKVFYNSISTLIRVIIIGVFFIIYFIQDKNKKKYFLIIYPVLLLIYFIFHQINAQNFKSLVPGNFDYSTIKEILYFVKMVTPFLLIYDIYEAKLSREQIINVIKYIVIIVSLIIIVTNIFGISYGSYSNTRIKANFFSWFNNKNNYTYQDLASKGFFEYANQISAVLIIFLPFMIMELQKNEKKVLNILIIIINIWALILLGTKVAVLGITIDILFTIFIIIFNKIINKEQINIKNLLLLLIPIVFYMSILPFNPMFNRQNERDKTIETFLDENSEKNYIENKEDITINEISEIETTEANVMTKEEKMNYVEVIAAKKNLPEQFFKQNYSYECDIDFWYDFVQNDIAVTTDYRTVEIAMVKRVIEINNNKCDKWVGITNTRLQNIFNIERDFVVQYFALGIIGTILVFLPYMCILILFTVYVFKNKFKNINKYQYLCYGLTIFSFAIAFYSGNLLNSLSFTIYLGILIAGIKQ